MYMLAVSIVMRMVRTFACSRQQRHVEIRLLAPYSNSHTYANAYLCFASLLSHTHSFDPMKRTISILTLNNFSNFNTLDIRFSFHFYNIDCCCCCCCHNGEVACKVCVVISPLPLLCFLPMVSLMSPSVSQLVMVQLFLTHARDARAFNYFISFYFISLAFFFCVIRTFFAFNILQSYPVRFTVLYFFSLCVERKRRAVRKRRKCWWHRICLALDRNVARSPTRGFETISVDLSRSTSAHTYLCLCHPIDLLQSVYNFHIASAIVPF